MKKEKHISDSLKKGVKGCLNLALKTNANSSGCFAVYQPTAPKALKRFKDFK